MTYSVELLRLVGFCLCILPGLIVAPLFLKGIYQWILRERIKFRRRYGVGWISEAWELFCLAPLSWIVGLFCAWLFLLVVEIILELPFEYPFAGFRSSIHGGASIGLLPWQWAYYPFVILGVMLCGSFVTSGSLRMALAAMRLRNVRVGDAFSGWPSTLRVFGYSMVYTIGVYIACVLPGAAIVYCVLNHGNLAVSVAVIVVSVFIILAVLVFSTFLAVGMVLVVDGVSVWEAFKRVFTTMRPHYGTVLGVIAIMTLLSIGSICTMGLAFIVLFPMFWIIQALIGRDTLGIAGPAELPVDWLGPGSEPQPGAWPPPPAI